MLSSTEGNLSKILVNICFRREIYVFFKLGRRFQEEAENRKQKFWTLIQEHNAVIEKLKKIKELESNIQNNKAPPEET